MHEYELTIGPHRRPGGGRCAMEWVAHLAGESHTDAPSTVSPVLAAFTRSRIDALDDHARQRLRPYLARTIGTAGDGLDEWRAWLCTDWLVRGCVPALVEHAGVTMGLWRLDPIVGEDAARDAEPLMLDTARAAALARRMRRDPAVLDGARHATRALTRAAGWEAARAAVRAAEPCAARMSIVDAACRTARDAAWAAAWRDAPAPWTTARPVAETLQQATFALLDALLPGVTVSALREAVAA
jgi:hypothetical protein